MKSYFTITLTGLLMLSFASPVLAAKQPPQQPQTEKPQQPEKKAPHRGSERRE